MTVIDTVRFLLKKYTSGGDPHPTRVEFNAMIDKIEDNAAMGAQGVTGARPAAGKGRRFFWDETAQRMSYDDGANWKDLNPNGGGGGAKVTPGTDGVEGASTRSARADHTHRLDLATSTIPGAMSAADKLLLDSATPNSATNALAKRDGNARLSANTPVDPFHVATKAYVDGLITETANYVDATVAPYGEISPGTSLLAGAAKPADKPWRVFEGMVRTTTGAGGESRTASGATNTLGYAGAWFGYQGLPVFEGIYSVQLTGYHAIESFQYLPTLADVSLTRIKWRGRRADNTGWANGYANVDVMVRVVGW
jgi:hypothetical protein